MIRHAITRILIASTVIGSFLFAGVASAIDWNITGFVRQEIAYGISSHKNDNNIGGDPYNDQIVPHYTHAAFNADNPGLLMGPGGRPLYLYVLYGLSTRKSLLYNRLFLPGIIY